MTTIDSIIPKIVKDIKGKTSTDASEIELNLDDPNIIFKIVTKLLTDNMTKIGKSARFKLAINSDNVILIKPALKETDQTKWYDEVRKIINSVFYRKDNVMALMDDTATNDNIYMMYKEEEYEIGVNIIIKSEPVFKNKRRIGVSIKVSEENAQHISEVVSVKTKVKKAIKNVNDSDNEE